MLLWWDRCFTQFRLYFCCVFCNIVVQYVRRWYEGHVTCLCFLWMKHQEYILETSKNNLRIDFLSTCDPKRRELWFTDHSSKNRTMTIAIAKALKVDSECSQMMYETPPLTDRRYLRCASSIKHNLQRRFCTTVIPSLCNVKYTLTCSCTHSCYDSCALTSPTGRTPFTLSATPSPSVFHQSRPEVAAQSSGTRYW